MTDDKTETVWSDEKTEQLILVQLINPHECLWKTTIKDYSDRNVRLKALQVVARELNVKRKLQFVMSCVV